MYMNKLKVATAAIALLTTVPSLAADIARDVHEGNRSNDSFFEVGVIILKEEIPLIGFEDNNETSIRLDFQGRFEFKGFYAEAIQSSFSNITLGYNVYNAKSSSVDIIATQFFQRIDRDDIEGFETISDREEDVDIGVRGNYHLGNNILQFELVGDVSGAHDGIIASAQYAYNTQYRNWNLHALTGVRYFSDKVLDHYFSVPVEEATSSVNTYRADQGFLPSIQIGGALPITENWVFRTSVEYALLPDSVSDSPLAFGDDLYTIRAGIYRVIYP